MKVSQSEMHGNHHIPRNRFMTYEFIYNEYGTPYKTRWSLANMESNEPLQFVDLRTEADVVLLTDPEYDDCSCDACRGFSDIYDQHEFVE
jgi:hypothetical protein